MNRLVLEAMHKPLVGYNPVTFSHLNREVVIADRNIAHYIKHVQWDIAQAWSTYREDVQFWRYTMMRRERPLPALEVCPSCGRVQETEMHAARCGACGWQWDGATEAVEPETADV